MKEIIGNIWNFHNQGKWVVIPTNGSVNSKSEAVMGAGLALQAKQKWPELPSALGQAIKAQGRNSLVHISVEGLILFPTKRDWWEDSSLEIIEHGLKELIALLDIVGNPPIPIYLPRLGCGNGKLIWKDVKPLLENYLDGRFTVVSQEPNESETGDY